MSRPTILAALLFAGQLVWQASAKSEEVDLELVLLADASLSIDEAELRFQRQGYASALTHPQVLAAIGRGLLGRIAVTFVEWADESSQEVVVPWTVIDGPASAATFARALLAAPRGAYGMNAIGSALAAGQALIESNRFTALKRVIDFSADSANSYSGVPIFEARRAALAAGIIINGLAILCREDDCSGQPIAYDLVEAFKTQIIGGPTSFVVSVDGDQGFAEAVRRKLVLEIGAAPPVGDGSGERLATMAQGSAPPAARSAGSR